MNESVIIGSSEKFLDRIKRETVDLNDVASISGFLRIYQYLKENLEELQERKDTMESKGYKAPYRSLSRYGSTNPGEVMFEELHEVNRHSQYFRMKASAKKNILDRVNSSISSHKIALGNLDEYAALRCKSCDKSYRANEITNFEMISCACGSSDFNLKVNESGLHRIEIIPYLPLSGNYMAVMSELSPRGRESFKKVVKVLKQEKKGVVKTVSLVIRVLESGRWIRKRVSMEGVDGQNYEKELRKKYGSNVRIEFLQFHRIKPTIINDRHTRNALSLGYVRFSEHFIQNIIGEILESRLSNLKKVKLYETLRQKAQHFEPSLIEEFENLEDIRKEELDFLLLENNLMNANGELDRELSRNLKKKSLIEKKLFKGIPLTLIMWDIIKYYLSTSYDRRNKYSGPFPNLRLNLDRNQVKVFQDFDKDVVNILKTYKSEKIVYIPHIQKVLLKKFELEQKMKGLHMKTNLAAFGAAVISLESGISIETTSELFSVSIKDVQTEKKNMETMGKPTTPKAKKFMEMIKK
jgi:Zn-finger domain-containing protein